MEDLVESIRSGNYKNVVVLTGAGISTSAGIPDFRSPSIGLYATLKQMGHLRLKSPTFVFDFGEFMRDPRPFWWVFSDLWPKEEWPLPTPFHYLITLLNNHGLLRRCYTQNVDDLETLAGLPADKLICAHGVLTPCHCMDCHKEVSLKHCVDTIQPNFQKKHSTYDDIIVPLCPHCGKDHVKPDVVFFGQNLPQVFFSNFKTDLDECDLLIVAGTSLEVHPFAGLPGHVKDDCKRFLINRDRVREKGGSLKNAWNWVKSAATLFLFEHEGMFQFGDGRDFFIGGDLQDNATEVITKLGWDGELEEAKEQSRQSNHPLYTLTRELNEPTHEAAPPPAEEK